ncbi:MAG: site-specific integrase [Muribaculaceae bacterium]|nr:site-specific integrase [Ruminococcus flavefaciens]MCM1297679.1 site-specific integrase [Muribaculaceae bacterium]
MKGSIQVKRGLLYGVICYNDEFGQSKQKWIATGLPERGNKKEAQKILEKEMKAFEEQQMLSLKKLERRSKGDDADKTKAGMPFSKWCDLYVDTLKDVVSPSVFYNYKQHYIKLFKDYFDKRHLRLIDITEKEIQEFYDDRLANGVKVASLRHYNNVLRPALRKAFLEKLIPDNPFDYLKPLKKEKVAMSYYDKNEMKKLFEVIKGHSLEVPFMLAAYYGFRRSEVLGLRWSAVDFEHKLITVNHKLIVLEKEMYFSDELKTNTSNRTLPLIPVIEELLLKHKKKIEENKTFYGNTYDTRYLEYICVEENGQIVYPDHMTKMFAKLLKDNGLKHIRLHDLRHSCASNMLASGVSMKEIQEWLGHSNFSTTADVYSHLDFSAKVRAASTIASTYGDNARGIMDLGEVSQQNMSGLLIQALKEMQKLGFEKIDDYISYKERKVTN